MYMRRETVHFLSKHDTHEFSNRTHLRALSVHQECDHGQTSPGYLFTACPYKTVSGEIVLCICLTYLLDRRYDEGSDRFLDCYLEIPGLSPKDAAVAHVTRYYARKAAGKDFLVKAAEGILLVLRVACFSH